jgi:hypothetical protein
MKRVLVDSSVWVDYFSGGGATAVLSDLIDLNLPCVNGLILTELIPFLIRKNQNEPARLLAELESVPLDINWKGLTEMQTINLARGINKVGVPDLIIAQNVMQNDLELFSLDKHFTLMSKVFKFKMFR